MLHVSVQGITEACSLCSTGGTAEQVLGSLPSWGVGGCGGCFSRVLGTVGISGENCASGQGQQGSQAKGKCVVGCRRARVPRGGGEGPANPQLQQAGPNHPNRLPLALLWASHPVGALESSQPGRLELEGPLLQLGA